MKSEHLLCWYIYYLRNGFHLWGRQPRCSLHHVPHDRLLQITQNLGIVTMIFILPDTDLNNGYYFLGMYI